MKHVKVSEVKGFPYHYPSNASVVTSRDGERKNCIALSRHAWFAFKPPMYGIGVGTNKYTCELIKASGEFVINWLPFDAVTTIAAAGSKSGRDVDKFERFNIETLDPLVVSSPLLASAYAAYECRVASQYVIGDSTWFAGDIVAIHYDEDVFENTLKMDKISPVLWLSKETYAKAENPRIYRVDRVALTVDEI